MSGYDRDEDRQRLLTTILNHVPFDGWSEAALQAASQETGIPAERVLNAFPGGAKDVLILWHEVADQQMIAAMGRPENVHLRTRDRVAAAIRARLEANASHREAVRAGCALLLMPQNAGTATRLSTTRSMPSGMRSATNRPTTISTPSGLCWPASIPPR